LPASSNSPYPHESAKSQFVCRLDYFFCHAKTNDVQNIGHEIARLLQVHDRLESRFTYSLIGLKIFQDFLQSYKPPFSLLHPLKWLLKGAIRAADNMVGGVFSEILGEITGDSLDKIFERANEQVQRLLKNKHTADSFQQYCQSKPLGSILSGSYSPGRRYLSTHQFNESIFNALQNAHMLDGAFETITALHGFVTSVKAKALVLIIDDANDMTLLNSIVRFIDHLDELDGRAEDRPGVLLIVSMLQATYDRIKNTEVPDKALKHRICFKEPKTLRGPMNGEIGALLNRLLDLREPYQAIDDNVRQRITTDCSAPSFREAIECIGGHLRALENARA
jgi:hypothetical protein